MKKTVLIVDDIELSREILKNAVSLSEQHISVQFAENAFDAIKKMHSVSFDLIIMDIMMPNGDGFELLSMMSKKKVASKIIITSGLDKSIVSSASMLGKLYELDVVASLKKPIFSEQITKLTNKVFSNTKIKESTNSLAKIINDDFPINLVYQPQVFSNINVITGFEILSRWSDESGELLPPSYFLPVIEELGKQKLFTSIVIKKFLKDYHQYFRDLDKSLRFSINVYPDLLIDDVLIDQILDLYNQGIAHTIVIEIIEKGLTGKIERELLANVLKLRLNGFEISIDDFGIDSSNVERIIKLPISEIKIDKKITLGLADNIDYMQKLNEVKNLVSVKNARIIYEGIENKEICEFLETIGGYNQQGFYHGVAAGKVAMELHDINAGDPRLPLMPLSAEQKKTVVERMRAANFLK